MTAKSMALEPGSESRRGSIWLLVLALAFSVFALSYLHLRQAAVSSSPAQVPLKPCNTCAGCPCPKAMGSTRCMCPN